MDTPVHYVTSPAWSAGKSNNYHYSYTSYRHFLDMLSIKYFKMLVLGYAKRLLGIPAATNIGTLLEVGRANSLIIEPYKESLLMEKLPWVINIKNPLEENGMLTFFINVYDDKPCFVNKRMFQTLF